MGVDGMQIAQSHWQGEGTCAAMCIMAWCGEVTAYVVHPYEGRECSKDARQQRAGRASSSIGCAAMMIQELALRPAT
jgi:hypothetical protein